GRAVDPAPAPPHAPAAADGRLPRLRGARAHAVRAALAAEPCPGRRGAALRRRARRLRDRRGDGALLLDHRDGRLGQGQSRHVPAAGVRRDLRRGAPSRAVPLAGAGRDGADPRRRRVRLRDGGAPPAQPGAGGLYDARMSHYLHTCYRITDPERSQAFYEALGFEFRRKGDIVRNGELEATNYFFGMPGQEAELEL